MEHENEELNNEEIHMEEPVEEEALDEVEQEGPNLMARINIAAIAVALMILAGAIGFRAGMFDSSPANASSDQGQQLKQGSGQGPSTSSSGCGSGGCSSGSSGTGSSGGCGAGGGCGTSQGPVDVDALKLQVTGAYGKYSGQSGFHVEIQDLGCHQEATITRDGKTLDRISISGNRMSIIE